MAQPGGDIGVSIEIVGPWPSTSCGMHADSRLRERTIVQDLMTRLPQQENRSKARVIVAQLNPWGLPLGPELLTDRNTNSDRPVPQCFDGPFWSFLRGECDHRPVVRYRVCPAIVQLDTGFSTRRRRVPMLCHKGRLMRLANGWRECNKTNNIGSGRRGRMSCALSWIGTTTTANGISD